MMSTNTNIMSLQAAQGFTMESAAQKTTPTLDRESFLARYEAGERDFRDYQLDGIDLSNCQLSQCDLSGASLIGANFKGSCLREVNFSKANLTRSILSRANLSESDLSWARISGADLAGTDMHHAKARAANFSESLMIRTKMNDADCLGAIFCGINATAAQMESTNFECSDLSGATLMNANMCGANCSWANLTDARLNWANLSWCLLEAADLENANLTGTCLQAANLSFANMDNTVLTGADLYFANLSGTLLPPNQLPAARISSARLTSQTYSRSKWSRELLRDWQHKGAIILDFESLTRDVQKFIREGDCNMRIYFTHPIETASRTALEVLIFHLTHAQNSLRILSINNENDRGQVAFFSPNTSDIELFVSSLRGKSWHCDLESIEKEFHEYQAASHVDDLDIVQALDALAADIYHIQALIPVSAEDRTCKLQTKLEPCDKNIEKKTQVSWSSISLPKVER